MFNDVQCESIICRRCIRCIWLVILLPFCLDDIFIVSSNLFIWYVVGIIFWDRPKSSIRLHIKKSISWHSFWWVSWIYVVFSCFLFGPNFVTHPIISMVESIFGNTQMKYLSFECNWTFDVRIACWLSWSSIWMKNKNTFQKNE